MKPVYRKRVLIPGILVGAPAVAVVNDSLVMVDFINKAREEGVALKQAVIGSETA